MSLRQNALILLLLTAMVAIAGDWSGDAHVNHFWYIPAALLLIGLAYEAWMSTRAAPMLVVQAPSNWLLGRSTPIQLQLTQRLRRVLQFEIAPNAAPEVELDRSLRTLRASSKMQGSESLVATARRLGRYRWPPFRIRIGGALGLAWWPRALPIDGEIRVVPDIIHPSEAAQGAASRGAQAAKLSGSGSEILQLRDYRPDDAPRTIDWKASARTRRLICRDFSEDQQLNIVIAVDAGRSSGLAAGDTDRLALYANVAARLAQRAVALDDRVGLLIYAQQPLVAIAPSHGAAAVTRVRSLLAQMTVQRTDSNPALAAIRIRSLVSHRSLIILLTDLDDASATGELRSAVKLLLPKHLPFIAGVASERIETLAAARADDDLQVYRALAAQEYRIALQRNVASLRALGAPALLATAAKLDRAVVDAYLDFRLRRRV
jgi:uncharacterized protein (DUF58 family)